MQFKHCLIIILLLSGCATVPPSILHTVLSSQQVLIVTASHPIYSGTLSAWEKHQSVWKKVYNAPVVLGRNGLAPLDAKEEGDGYTPSGTYFLGTAFGYISYASTGLDYRQLTKDDFWVDDVASSQYNQWVHGKPQANSYEEMKRKDNLYLLGAVIEYNAHPIVPGKGSAIFMHIWRAYYKPTAGCIALSQRNLRKIISWLDKSKNPIIILVK